MTGFSKTDISALLANIVSFVAYLLLQSELINLFVYASLLMSATLLSIYCGFISNNKGLLIGQIPWFVINLYLMIRYLINVL